MNLGHISYGVCAAALAAVAVGAVFLASGDAARAEGRCPPGYYPVGGDRASDCAPIPGAQNGGGDGYDSEPASRPRRADTYGAIVWGIGRDGATRYNVTTGALPLGQAHASALSQCQSEGNSDCRLGLDFSNGYYAVAVAGKNEGAVDSGPSERIARQKAKAACQRIYNRSCKVVETGESLPR